jgi:hypothetical protein
MLAMDMSAIQGSSVPCEHVFSSGKETMSACWNQIKYDLMEALQMLKFTINGGNQLNFTAGLGWEAELYKLEGLDYLDSHVPEDLATFRHNLISSLDSDDFSILSDKSDLEIE